MNSFLRRLTLLLGVALIVTPLGCSDTTQPTETYGDGTGLFEGNVDPGAGTFVLQSIDIPVPGDAPIRVSLIGRNLSLIRDRGEVRLEVAVRNEDSRALYAPAEVVVDRFLPVVVSPVNASWMRCPPDTEVDRVFPGSCVYGFDYSTLLGDEGALTPGETSEFRAWVFRDPEVVPFSFRAAARFALAPDQATIAGFFFWDENENGRPDPDEGPAFGGHVRVVGPGMNGVTIQVGPEGRYSFPVRETGLYTLTAYPPPTLGFAPIRFTTPNPLEVVLTPGSDGGPQSFREAHFGMVTALPPPVIPPVIILEEPADSLILNHYAYLEGAINGSVLTLRVGYSGCQPEHPFQLFMVGGFMESNPVQARLVLSHDILGEFCEAYFEKTLRYDLTPIQVAYREAYGRLDPIILRFWDFQGQLHTFELKP